MENRKWERALFFRVHVCVWGEGGMGGGERMGLTYAGRVPPSLGSAVVQIVQKDPGTPVPNKASLVQHVTALGLVLSDVQVDLWLKFTGTRWCGLGKQEWERGVVVCCSSRGRGVDFALLPHGCDVQSSVG